MSAKNIELENAIYEYIKGYIEEYGYSPSIVEIATHFNCVYSNANRYVERLIASGRIIKNGKRQIIVGNKEQENMNKGLIAIPLVGSIACGTPLLAEENIDTYLTFKESMIGSSSYFALRANGNSMIDAGINDGDLVIVEKTDIAKEGDIIVALINDEATLKRFYLDRKNKKIILHPENKDMVDIVVENIIIQGKAIKVIKDL